MATWSYPRRYLRGEEWLRRARAAREAQPRLLAALARYDPAAVEGARELLAEIEPIAADFLDIDYGYAFGKWTETGRLAALSGNERLLRSRTMRKTQRAIREREWTEEVNTELDSIGNAIEDRGTELDLSQLETSFTKIINES